MTKGEEAGITNQGGEDDTEDEEEDEEEEKEGVREQHEEHGEHVKSKETDDEGWGRQEEHGGQGEYGGHSDTPIPANHQAICSYMKFQRFSLIVIFQLAFPNTYD
jgi:hypothetical protein